MSPATSTMVAAGRIWPNTSGVHLRDLTPTRNIGHIDPSADHVTQHRSCLVEGDLDAAQRFSCLSADVAGRPGPGRARYRDVWADAYRARVTDD